MVKIEFPDGSFKEFMKGVNGLDIVKSISERLLREAVAIEVNGEVKDLRDEILENCKIRIITSKDKESLSILRHSTAHLFAQALLRIFPGAKLAIGPSTEDGFYYDFLLDKFTEEDRDKVEEEMWRIVKEDLEIELLFLTYEEAKEFYKDNPFKLEILEELRNSGLSKFRFYKQGEFMDLCTGPHILRTGQIKAFKLDRLGAAYWKGDAENTQLRRIYGTAFWKKKELEDYYKLLEEAKKRDHRKLGKALNLIMFHDSSPGCAFFLPKGTVIYNELLNFLREEYRKRGYDEVITPNLFNKVLWETSGHWQHYKDDMFVFKVDDKLFSWKPMNCPSHCLIFRSKFRSYRELPLRLADFGVLHRNELTGTLSGLTRVRRFSQDDAHIFCTPDQIEEEIYKLLDFVKYVYKDVFNMEYNVFLSTRPKDSMGSDEIWELAENGLKNALQKRNIDFEINEGDGAFYGPKIDFVLKDSLGRDWQTATIQLDFNLPERFDLYYEDKNGNRVRPIMIHRAILGSLERFIGVLIEHFAGKFPLWLSPVQVKVITVADRHIEYANTIVKKLFDEGFRVETNYEKLTVPNKVRLAQEEKVNYIVVIGDKEVEKRTLAVRDRTNKTTEFTLDEFIMKIKEEKDKKLIL